MPSPHPQVQAASTDPQAVEPGAALSPEDIIYMVTKPPQFGYLEIEPSPFDDDNERGGGNGIAQDKQRQPETAPTSVLDGYPPSPFEVQSLHALKIQFSATSVACEYEGNMK